MEKKMRNENIEGNEGREKERIPKIIHYCWFGKKPIPANLQRCIDSWKKLDGYEVMRWDESNCSFDENEFVRKTYKEKKLGFIGDYYRLKAVYEYGGIYLDTDVLVNRSLDSLLEYPCFLNFIFDCSIGTAIIGAQKGNPLIKGLLDMYDCSVFGKNENGRVFEWKADQLIVDGYATSNYYFTYYILKHYPKFQLNNRLQNLTDFVIFPKEYFEIGMLTGRHFTIHLCAGEWREKAEQQEDGKGKMKKMIGTNQWLFDKTQIIVRKFRYHRMKRKIPFYSYYIAQKSHSQLPEL